MMTNEETAQLVMEGVMAGHKVRKAIKDMAGTIVESDREATDYRPRPPSK